MLNVTTSWMRLGAWLAGVPLALAALGAQDLPPPPPPAEPGPVRLLPDKRVYYATRIDGPAPRIDGSLDDPCWKLGEWSGDYRQREPHEGRPASQPTEIKILYDDGSVYVGIRAFDSQLASQPRLRGNRDQFVGDMVGVSLDSYFDQRTAFEFDVTSGGSQVDLLTADGGFDSSWNAVWEVKVGTEPGAWTAEFRIPLSQLRYANRREQTWGLHSFRKILRYQEESNWQLIPMDNPGFVLSFGELRGIRDLPPSRRIELLPYVVVRHATSAAVPGDPFHTGRDSTFAAGLDAKIGLGPNFTFDATVNPDFGQVEADPSELNLTTYETFLEERRPFFLEGKNIFSFGFGGDTLFYSRRIGHRPSFDPPTTGFRKLPATTRILGAAKVTGKTPEGLSVGVLYGLTDREHARLWEDGVERSVAVEPLTHYVVARLQQDFDRGRTVVGGMVTATARDIADPTLAFLPSRALTGGLDFEHRWNDRACYLEAQWTGSRVAGDAAAISRLMRNPVHNYQRPDAGHLELDDAATHLAGQGGSIEIGKSSGGRWRYDLELQWRSPGLELNDLGYLYAADCLEQSASLEYVVTNPVAHVRRYNIELDQRRLFDFNGTRLQDNIGIDGGPTFNNNWSLWGHAGYASELLDTRVLRGGPAVLLPASIDAGLQLESDSSKDLHFWIGGDVSASPDRRSRFDQIRPGVALRPADAVRVEAEIARSRRREDFQYAGTGLSDSGARYLMGRMNQTTLRTTLRVDVNFTPQLSLSCFGSVFATAGTYDDFKWITRPRARRYADRFERVAPLGTEEQSRSFVRDGEFVTIGNPDFNWREFQSNIVLRWEFRAGSTLYAVWSQNRVSAERTERFSPGSEIRRLFGAHPDNTFLLKVSTWFDR